MIDIHNHVVFSVDDGSKSIEQSIRMIKTASEAGITEMCFTPHYMEDGYQTERNVLEEKVFQIKEALASEKVNMKVYLGEEVFIFPNLPRSLDKVVCLNDSRYILIEFPLVEEVGYIEETIYELFSLGKVPIIAHPERYMATASDFSFIQNIAAQGALLQINANSLVGHYGREAKKLAMKLLAEDMVHFVGSDAHSSGGYELLNESLKVLSGLVSKEKYIELTEKNPGKVLNDEEIEQTYRKAEKKQKRGLLKSLLQVVG